VLDAARWIGSDEGNTFAGLTYVSTRELAGAYCNATHINGDVHTLSMGGTSGLHADQKVIAAELNQQIVASMNTQGTRARPKEYAYVVAMQCVNYPAAWLQ
jgi:hypothetical protein